MRLPWLPQLNTTNGTHIVDIGNVVIRRCASASIRGSFNNGVHLLYDHRQHDVDLFSFDARIARRGGALYGKTRLGDLYYDTANH